MSDAFYPGPNRTVNINVSSSSQRVLVLDTDRSAEVRIMNDGTATVWITFGDANVTADTVNDFPIGAGVTEVLEADNIDVGGIYVAAIAAGSTGKIYFTPGRGV